MSRFNISTAALAAVLIAWALMGQALVPNWVPIAALVVHVALAALGVAFLEMQWFGPALCRCRSIAKEVAITFDDGPTPAGTPAILDALEQARVHATFFCVGSRAAASPELVGRIARAGHLLANHAFSHHPLTNFFSDARLFREFEDTSRALEQACGKRPSFLRPPIGLSNPGVFRAAARAGLRVVGWSARAMDTSSSRPERIVARLCRRLRPGAILMLHDGKLPPGAMATTLRSLLDRLRELGYQPVRLDALLSREKQGKTMRHPA